MSEVIDILTDMVAIPSVNPCDGEPDGELLGEARMVDYLEEFFSARGVDWVRQRALQGRENLIATVRGAEPGLVILEAHTDTVAVDGMAIDPFDPKLEDGKVYGRGACDDKASLAAMAVALARVAHKGVPRRTCVLAATCDEEYRFGGVKRLLSHPQEVGLTEDELTGAMACVGEPTGLDVVIAHKGAFRWRMRTHGQAAHSSEPENGQNAIYEMARLISVLHDYLQALKERPKHPLVGGPTFSVGVIRGGSAVNIVPDLCEILVDRRLVPGEDGYVVQGEIEQYIGDAVNYTLEVLLEDWPLETPEDAEIVRLTRKAAEEVLGQAVVTGVQYGTDASKMCRSGIECVVCGPGHIDQAHTAVEWVDAQQVEDAVEVYERVLTGRV